MRRHRLLPRDTGSVATEMVMLVPVLIALVLFVVFAGRGGIAGEQVRHAADQGARAASNVHAGAMGWAAIGAVYDDLETNGSACHDPFVDLSTGRSGSLDTVTVTVTCTVRMRGLSLLGLDERTVRARSTEVIDRYRAGP